MDDSMLRKLLWATAVLGIVALLFLGFIIIFWPIDWNAFHHYQAHTAQRIIKFVAFLVFATLVLIAIVIAAFIREIKKQRQHMTERIRELEKKLDELKDVTIKGQMRNIYDKIYALEEKV
jgi:uncharacterized membrane protein (DUF106 family)